MVEPGTSNSRMLPLVVTTKEGPDVDGVACCLAFTEQLKAMGSPAVAVIDGRPDAEARFWLEQLGIETSALPPATVQGVVLVDISAIDGLPRFVDPAVVLEVIDHRSHGEPSHCFANAVVHVEMVGAAATIVFELFRQAGLVPSQKSSWLLQAGIQSNTQCLRGPVTTPRDVEAIALLHALHPLPDGMLQAQFAARRAEILADLDAAVQREAKTFDHADGRFVVSQLECHGALELVPQIERLALGGRFMVNLVDPVTPTSQLLVPDPLFRAWVEDRLGVAAPHGVMGAARGMLRKQIVARIMGNEEGG